MRALGRVALLLLMPAASAAQQAPVITLKPADGVLAHDMPLISSVRELADGRVIITDGRDNLINVADFAHHTVTQIGQVPGHPKDFVTAGLIYPFYHDTTVMTTSDLRTMTHTWVMFDGVTVLGVIPNDSPLIMAISRIRGGTDTAGCILATQVSHSMAGEPLQGTDSIYLVSVDHATALPDTVAHLAQSSGPGTMVHKGDSVDAFTKPMESAAMAPDGWIAVVRVNPYRVDWRSPDGRWLLGTPIPIPSAPLTAADKERYMPPIVNNPPEGWPTPGVRWPATMPPTRGLANAMATPDGCVLVARVTSGAEHGTSYDRIDRHGALAGTLTLPEGQNIVAFGAHSAYVLIRKDDSATLERHPWP
ncbi:MAG TPA: hypothetical protein VHW65_12600 [Gemmatimonadales bacterium]|nr:hypothetical protein [Gemmatimonadales bacterium]